ncbi:MAG TPA: hypothetical protein VNV62_26495 [Trebonia sp.]|nr:hypothetical protein [Trebonia sp.]
MFRAGKLTCLAVGAAGLVVAFTMLGQGMAMAAAGSGGPVTFALMAAPPKTFTATYSCDLSAYQSGSSSVTISATTIVPATAATITPVDVTVKTTSVALPSAVLSKLSGVVSFDLAASVTAKQSGVSVPVALSGDNPVSGTLKGLPAAAAASSTDPSQALVFSLPGSAQIEVPPTTLTFTPHTATTSLNAITCTTTAAKKDITITVTVGVVGTTGPLYDCVVGASVAGQSLKLEEFRAHVPMRVTSSGRRTTGKTDTVSLVAGIGGFFPPGAASARFSANLRVTGAQPGNVAMSEPITNLTDLETSASGKLPLTTAGTDQILVPEKFTFTYTAPVSGVPGSVPFTWACTLVTKPAPVGLTVKVTEAPQASSSPAPSSSATSNGGQPEGSGAPSGAPATGGGTGPGADMAVAAGGAAIAFSGGGLVIIGRRRYRYRDRNRNRSR